MWLRLDVDFDQSEWLAFLPKLSQMAWIDLLRHVKVHGNKEGKTKYRSPTVFAKHWGYDDPELVKLMFEAALSDGALIIEDNYIFVSGWVKYQSPAAERMKRHRASQSVTVADEASPVVTPVAVAVTVNGKSKKKNIL